MSFPTRLWTAVRTKGTPAMVGLDPRLEHLPEPFRGRAVGASPARAAAVLRDYHRELLDVVAPLVPAVKPQAAFFELLGPPGWEALADAVVAARERGLVVVLDAKRGDIGSTADAYARALLLGGHGGCAFPPADALTVNPWLGEDALEPFVTAAQEAGAGLFVLLRTSNPGADLLQAGPAPTPAERVAGMLAGWAEEWRDASGWCPAGAVVGATRPEELGRWRELLPHTPFLIPGFGYQGGTAADLAPAFDRTGLGALVNASRSILWAHERADLAHLPGWQEQVEAAVREMIEALAAVAGGTGG